MKRLIIFMALLFFCSCQSDDDFKKYRNNPFQYPYSEYYLKAKVVSPPILSPLSKPSFVDVDSHQISFRVNRTKPITVIKKNNAVHLKFNDKLIGLLNIEEEKYMGCLGKTKEYEKDFCSSFNSSEEYYTKLFTLTPDDLSKDKYAAVGNKWIIHNKGSWFRDVEKILIYKTSNLTAFRRDFKASSDKKVKTELIVFHNKLAPNYLGIAFTILDEDVIASFLNTLEIQ